MGHYEQAKSEYLRTKVLTASPEELHLMLLDGAIKFAQQAREAVARKDFEEAYNASVRVQNIVLELTSALNHSIAPEICGKLSSLYNFIYRRLVEGSIKHDPACFDDALKILEYQRETWVMLMDKLASERKEASEAASSDEHETVPPDRPSLSLNA
jgi:flagellar protein FliS